MYLLEQARKQTDDWVNKAAALTDERFGELQALQPGIAVTVLAAEILTGASLLARESICEWMQGPVVCAHCGHSWRAVRPVDTDTLECPSCHKMFGYGPSLGDQ